MYLPSIAYYRAQLRSELGIGEAPAAPVPPTRAIIRGAWGEQTLTVPVEGGRRRLLHTPFRELRLSEHGNWRHTHWQAITSAYGALPYFHFLEDAFAEIYAQPAGRLCDLCASLDEAFRHGAQLPQAIEWLREHPERKLSLPADASDFPSHISAVELLFSRGPETVFYLLGD